MIRLNDILEKVGRNFPGADLSLIEKAYVYSAKVHQGQTRLSGEPYLIHPLEVAAILADMKMDIATVAAGLLHDTVEDTFASLSDIKETFGAEIADLVDGLTKISRMTLSTHEERQSENFRKMLLAMAKDIRIVIIKLADRLHNMRTLQYLSPESQVKIAQETLDIYAPIANRLGIDRIKTELEDLSFRYLHGDEYRRLEEGIAWRKEEREKYIQEVSSVITEKLAAYGLKGRVSGRPKHFYSVYRKMKAQNLEFEQVYDLIAFRIILSSIKDCYEALGMIHSLWKPVPGRFKDYIAMPKANGYQSLHTTVIGPYGERVEIQIRTEEMNRTAEEGIAAHWQYKEGKAFGSKDTKQFAWVRQLLEWQQDLRDPREFLETVKIDLFPDEVYVFTPKGAVKQFPVGATPVDFAYSIHTEVGHHCVGAKVNGKIVPLRYQLKNGDTVEITTNPNHRPSKDWLKFVQTVRARTKIKQWIKAEARERSVDLGKEMCEREFKKYHLDFAKFLKSEDVGKIAGDFSLETIDDLMAEIGYGNVSCKQIVGKLLPPEKLEPGKVESRLKRLAQKIRREPTGIQIRGIQDMMVRFGKCCSPLPGDPITGYITRGRGVTVHTADCPNVLGSDPERLIQVTWNLQEKAVHPVRVRVTARDKKGLLADITSALATSEINIVRANVVTTEDKKAIGSFEVEVRDLKHLNAAFRSLGKLKNVLKVERVRGMLSQNGDGKEEE
ncbi:MAG TPA: bifunctional (p)ppGpp synthetase/guanosine-3',5'-bis(diphosphate) 3'-pyrophosphohydrolase [Thermodesulfobacteriota bacterium]|nr:bifunctional (p)ppGpp synthetase/guanosine-3',5'-bis(diphosphate) 3'-pyrophosphohydrolase [Thermodesulfobacteriota bacterium]